MVQLIQLTLADPGHQGSIVSPEITVNVRNILMIEDYQGKNHEAQSRVVLENGKILNVTESQDEIRDLANGNSGGLI